MTPSSGATIGTPRNERMSGWPRGHQPRKRGSSWMSVVRNGSASTSLAPSIPCGRGRGPREAAPRMLRDTLGPLIAFYVGWKAVGLAVGVLAALVAGLGALWLARREGRPGAFVRVVLAIVVVRALVGLIGHSTTVYLAQDAAIDVALGAVFLGSLAAGRPV